jgi:DNA-binding FrmR family transcriptional regulator
MSVEPKQAPGYLDDKEAILRRLSRIEGQVRGLGRMVDDEAYCIDVLTQIAAVERALDGVAVRLLSDHTSHCVRDAVRRGGPEADEKVGELMAAVERFTRTR